MQESLKEFSSKDKKYPKLSENLLTTTPGKIWTSQWTWMSSKEYSESMTVILSQKNFITTWKFLWMNLKLSLTIFSKHLSEQKMPKSTLLIQKNTNSILKSNLEEAILTMDSKNILIMIEKFFLSKLYGTIPLLKEDTTFTLWTTS